MTARQQEGDDFARNLSAALKKRRMEIIQLADLLGVCRRRMRRLVSGEVLPTLGEVPKIARRLQVEPARLAWDHPDHFVRYLLGAS